MIRVCFVCLGNICRSPSAEAVMRRLVRDAGLKSVIHVESAGTGDYHVGEPADHRARAAAKRRQLSLDGRARQFTSSDWDRFDYVIGLDPANLRDLRKTARGGAQVSKLYLLRSFDPNARADAAVPDPYYGDDEGFDQVFELCEVACKGLLERIRKEHGI